MPISTEVHKWTQESGKVPEDSDTKTVTHLLRIALKKHFFITIFHFHTYILVHSDIILQLMDAITYLCKIHLPNKNQSAKGT